MANAIDLKKFKAKKKEVSDNTKFRRNYAQLDAWERETWQTYLDACEAMSKLFAQVEEPWRRPNDHLPQIVIFSIDSIIEKLNKGR